MASISVAMAVYNGEKYIKEQIDSIMVQLRENDELIISYNDSIDKTWNIINDYSNHDTRVKVFKCKKRGVLSNFQNAIEKCSNSIIFLSDQDDVWVPHKIQSVLKYFSDEIDGVVHSSLIVDSALNPIESVQRKNLSAGKVVKPLEIVKKNYIQGCCIAFRRKLISAILPFPHQIPMHDSWIGMIVSTYGKLIYVDEPLVLYRQHSGTVTSRQHKKTNEMIRDRFNLVSSYLKRRYELILNNNSK